MAITTVSGAKPSASDKFSPSSSYMELIEYDQTNLTMDVTFKTGSKHRYFRVYPSTFQSFKQSPTHDSYYSRVIRGNFMSAKLVDGSIGRKAQGPLNKNKKEHTLDHGLRSSQSNPKRIAGTVNRAFAASPA